MTDQSVRFSLETPLGVTTVVGQMEIDEALDQPYVARVRFEAEDPDAQPEALLGQDVLLAWERDSYRRQLCGLVRRVREQGRSDRYTAFEIEMVPALSLLDLTRNTRMFQQQSVPEILETVLAEKLGAYGRSVQLELSADYPTREYSLQYAESDLAFVQRLMEEEGIAYSFEHTGEVEVLVLRDSNDAYARLEGVPDPILFQPHDLVVTDSEPITAFDRQHHSTTTSVALRDFDWSTAGFLVEHGEAGEDSRGKVRESYEHGWGKSVTLWGYDGARYGERDATRQASVRLEAHRAPAVVGHGVSRVIGLLPGGTMDLSGHPMLGVDGEYLVTRVRHTNEALGGDNREEYHNSFECIPLATPHRPARRTEKPRIPSIQTAVVTGPSGEEIHTDEHGRIKVKFHWDREIPADETSSCWVRVQQKWAGSGWGFWWLPRIGMEVVVEFIDGDPDRPLVTGAVYNGTNATPYALPDDKTKSTIRSSSSPGGGGFNELRFEDKAGGEEIYSHAQKDYNEVVENDHTTHVKHDQTIQVDNDQTQTIHNNQIEDVGVDQTLTVDANRTVHVESNFDETVDGTETRSVTGDVTETFDGNETRDISGDVTESIGASEARNLSASQTEAISGNLDVTISGSSTETVSAALEETVLGGLTTTTPAGWTVTAPGGLNITAAGGFNLTATGGLQIAAPGGVQQVDTFVEWIGGAKSDSGAFSRGFAAFKFEIYVGHFALTTQKVGYSGAVIPNAGIVLAMHTDEDDKFGCVLKAGTIKVDSWGVQLND